MTDRETKKGKATAKPAGFQAAGGPSSGTRSERDARASARRGLVSALHERAAAAHTDPFDDDELDAMLETTVGGADEPRLVLRERVLTGVRTRREV